MQKNWQDLVAFIRFVTMRFQQDRCAQIAASLTFTTLLSLVPLIAIVLALLSSFPIFEDSSGQIKNHLLDNILPDATGKIVPQYMQQFAESAARMSAYGFVFLAVTAMFMLQTIDQAFNTIWRVTRPRPMLKRWIVYWVVLTLAPLLVGASLSLTSWLVGFSLGYTEYLPRFGVLALKGLPVLFTTLAFALLFRLVPNRYVPRMHAFIGGVVASVLFETMNRIFGYYIAHFPAYKVVYGAFASVPIFLVWIYLSWLMVLLGAVVAAALPHWRTSQREHLPAVAEMLDALRVLKIMSEGMRHGAVITIPMLSKKLRLGFFPLEKIMERLVSAELVCKAEGCGWLMVRDVAHIRAAELLHLFVLDRGSLVAGQNEDNLKQWFANCAAQLEKNTDVTLQELFDSNQA